MKTLKIQFLAMAIFALLFIACNGRSASNMTGTYVNHASSEFSIADDTLVVEHDKDQNYLIHRKTGFQVMDESGKKGKSQHETEEWNAVLDEGSQSMTENHKGRIISFDMTKGVLTLENSKYQRIN
jgi:hypothetical protein